MRDKMETVRKLCLKYKSEILYLFFGGCTTLVNIVCYYIFYQCLHVSNAASTTAAWVVSVAFAYVTNRQFVFESEVTKFKEWVQEALEFFGCRLATGVMDVAIMVAAVDYMHWNSLLWKVISNVLVVVLNYIAGKFLIFKKK